MTRLLPTAVASVVFAFALCNNVSSQNIQLSPEGIQRKAAHTFLFNEFVSDKQAEITGQEPNQILKEVTLSSKRVEVDGELLITLPEGSQRVASLFRYVLLRGEGLQNLEGLTMLPYAADSNLAVSTKTPELYRVKVPSMPTPSESMPPIQIRSRTKPGTKAVITAVALNSQGKLSSVFNDIPYRNLGAEFPRESVEIKIDINRELSVAGHVDLERDKFCRYYAAPGNLDASLENWAAERNFAPGRQIMKLQPGLVVGYSKNQPQLTETKPGSGIADLSFFDHYSSAPSPTIERFRNLKYAMCFNDYPEFMSVKHVGRGTPLIEHFDHAAELAAAYVADQIEESGQSAEWWEVKNESTIKSEWDYHWNDKYDAWALMADFHNRVADAIHKRSPSTKVGGPSSAWMQLQVSNFGLYRNQAKFMDLTKDHVDFYSHHFYEDFGSLGAWESRGGNYTNYMLGRMESILDMFQAHMHETDNLKPIIITECGSLQPGRSPSDYWLRMRSYSAYMNKLMQRPEQIELTVPFMFLTVPWNPGSGNAAFIPKEGKRGHSPLEDCDATTLASVFDLWSHFDGRRLPVTFERPWLDINAVHQGDQIQLAVTNMGGRLVSLNLSTVSGKLPLESVTQKRLFYKDGEVHYQDNISHADAASIPVDVEETTIVTLKLAHPLRIQGTTERHSYYAAGTALDSRTAADHGYEILVDQAKTVEFATLVVGVERKGGLQNPLTGTFNGNSISLNNAWAKDFNHLFASLKLSLPVEQLQESNTIQFDSQDGLTITSVHLITDHLKSSTK